MNSNYYDILRCNTSVDLTREELPELGRKSPYFKYVEFPVEVVKEIELWIGINESHQTASTG